MPRRKRVESEREMEKQLDEFVTRGFKIQEQGQHSSKVKEKDYGNAPVHVFTFLFSFLGASILFDATGLPSGGVWVVAIGAPLAYTAYSYLTAEAVLIQVDESMQQPETEDDRSDSSAAPTRDAGAVE